MTAGWNNATSSTGMEPAGGRSLLDDWVFEVGEQEIARVAEATRRDASTGRLASFTDKEALLAYWRAASRSPA